MKRTSLFEAHQNAGAKFVDFTGWEMPISYGSLKNEILAVRNDCGVFDVSHMGEFFIEGTQAVEFAQSLICNNFNVPVGKAVYSPLLNNEGKIIDDLIIYKISNTKVLVCVNASNEEKDWNWISSLKEKSSFDCRLVRMSDEISLVALQGKSSQEILSSFFKDQDFEALDYYEVREFSYNNEESIVARTGYTGEDGFEVFMSHKEIQNFWKHCIDNNVTPCGLGSRDTLRLEVCYPLYGNELREDLTPLDCALKWTVKNESEYPGKKALEDYKSTHRLVKLSLEKGIPRKGYLVLNDKGEKVGEISSGTMSPTLNKGIALALIERDKFPENKQFSIEIRGKSYEANYHTKPFYTGGHK